jgi:REP element-mobilizing transposase RayT
LAEKLQQDGIEVIVISVDAKHVHILARFRDHNVRHWVGRAKKHASHSVRQHGLRTEEGGLWAKRSHPTPIADRRHEVKVAGYIIDHAKKGARIWRCDREKIEAQKARG